MNEIFETPTSRMQILQEIFPIRKSKTIDLSELNSISINLLDLFNEKPEKPEKPSLKRQDRRKNLNVPGVPGETLTPHYSPVSHM
jgi:hypothetical protein